MNLLVAPLHRHEQHRGGAGPAVRSGGSRFLALRRRRERPDHPARAGGAARLACRRVVVGRRNRQQFAVDRHRDRQCRPRSRLSRFPRCPDRRGDRALPRHHPPPPHPGGPGARAFRHRAPSARSIPARNFRGSGCTMPASACGLPRSRHPRRCSALATAAMQSPTCKTRFGVTATGSIASGIHDEATAAVVTAFQRHFRQARVDGRADRSTAADAARAAYCAGRQTGLTRASGG